MKIITEYVKNRSKHNKPITIFLGVAVATTLLTAFILFYAITFYLMSHHKDWTTADFIRTLTESIFFITGTIILFVFLLYNLFKISLQKRLKELGLLKSLGAGPRSIKKVLYLESLFNSLAPVFIGMAAGTLAEYFIIKLIEFFNSSSASYKSLDDTISYFYIPFKFNPAAYLIIFILAELTVFISIFLSAKKALQYNPMQMLTEQFDIKKKKLKLAKTYKQELFQSYKKYFTPVSRIIAAGYIILIFFLSILSSMLISNKYTYEASQYNFNIKINPDNKRIDLSALFNKLKNINGVNKTYRSLEIKTRIKASENIFSNEFKNNTKGKSLKYFNKNYKNNDTYNLSTLCIGVEKEVYQLFTETGHIPENAEALIINKVKKNTYEPNHNPNTVPFFNDNLTSIDFNTKNNQGEDIFRTIPVQLISEIPDGIEINAYRSTPYNYSAVIIMPREKLETLYDECFCNNKESYRTYYFFFNIKDELFSDAAKKITDTLKQNEYVNDVRFRLYNAHIKNKENINDTYKFAAIVLIILFVIFLLCIINAYAAITTSLRQRRKEIAVAVSIGLSKKNLKHLFIKEALLHCIIPILKALPFCFLVTYLYSTGWIIFSFGKLLANINYFFIFAYICTIWLSIFIIYLMNIKEYINKKLIELITRAI